MKKKRILFILPSALHIRNFLTSGFVDRFVTKAEILLMIPERYEPELSNRIRKNARVDYIDHYQGSKFRKNALTFFRLASMISRKNMNSTYRHKIRELLVLSKNIHRLKNTLKALVLILASSFLDLEKWIRKMESYFPLQEKAVQLLDRFKPDLVFSSTVIHETLDIEIIKAARQKGIRTMMFVASWDNLTTKGLFLHKPDNLLVWGEEDKRSAIREHGFREDQIEITGTPHFDMYFDKRLIEKRKKFLKKRGIPASKKVIMFAGTTFSKFAEEPLIVQKLAQYYLDKNPDVLFWYRPHPRAIKQFNINDLKKYSNVYIDEKILEKIEMNEQDFFTDKSNLLHYPNMINACIGVISVLSTMAVEFALFKKPSLMINFGLDRRGHVIPGKNTRLSDREHLKSVLSWKGVLLLNDFDSLTSAIDKMLKGEFKKYEKDLQKSASTIAYNTDSKAQDRIMKAILRA
ncbi:MAG: CDP-glycerol glycerophosphotransferase family protein [Spirochaetes bacterium]|nr:CDP-glycerol glycerophosphotransferase family protein [Spirochaetota bacterium]